MREICVLSVVSYWLGYERDRKTFFRLNSLIQGIITDKCLIIKAYHLRAKLVHRKSALLHRQSRFLLHDATLAMTFILLPPLRLQIRASRQTRNVIRGHDRRFRPFFRRLDGRHRRPNDPSSASDSFDVLPTANPVPCLLKSTRFFLFGIVLLLRMTISFVLDRQFASLVVPTEIIRRHDAFKLLSRVVAYFPRIE